MATELLSAKLLAPTFGSSLLVWTSIITVTMLGIAIGYYLGGRLSQREQPLKKIFVLFLMAGVTLFVYSLIGFEISNFCIELGIVPGSLTASLFITGIPLVLYGMIGPLCIRVLSSNYSGAGATSGSAYLISTTGGVLFTFLFGLYFIPYQGVTLSMQLVAGALLVIGTVLAAKSR